MVISTVATTTDSIHQLFEAQTNQNPDAIAVECQGNVLTYQELNTKANQLAHYLQSLGVKPDTLVGLCVERSLKMFVALLGILKAGGSYVPLDPAYPQERLEFMLEDSQIPVLVTQQSLAGHLPCAHHMHVAYLDRDWSTISAFSTANLTNNRATAKNLAYTIYTSGSTGKPKGVQISHKAVVNLLTSMAENLAITPQDVVLATNTISFDMAVPELYLAFVAGASIHLVRRETVTEPKQLAQVIEASGATFMQATPSMWQLLLGVGWQGSDRLRILCGGEAMTPDLAQQLIKRGRSLWNMYGPTETTVWSAMHQVTAETHCVSVIGQPLANTQLYLLKTSDQHNTGRPIDAQSKTNAQKLIPVAEGEIGEVYIGGWGVARGYLNRPELNQQRFIPDPFRLFSPGNTPRLYKTGDLAKATGSGTFEFVGRADHQVKIRGFRVELGDIETVLSQHSSVQEVAVLAPKDTTGNNRLVAYVVPKHEIFEEQGIESIDTPTAKHNCYQASSPKNNTKTSASSSAPIHSSHLNSSRQIQQWQSIWDTTYSQSSELQDPTFNSTGWNNSYDGLPMPTDEIQEWVTSTVSRILDLQPKRVLEIGCGMGLLLFRIAPHCDQYCGIDISKTAINHIQQQIESQDMGAVDVQVSQKSAHELDGFEAASFDTVILNSVIQYFPDVEYLVDVIEKITALVKPGGRIFIGDVRSLPLLETLHTSIQLGQAELSLSITQLKQRIADSLKRDRELVLHPDLFTALHRQISRISHVDLPIKRGRTTNELTRFRYDAVLHIETTSVGLETRRNAMQFDWSDQTLSLDALQQILNTQPHQTIQVTNIPDGRILEELQAVISLSQASSRTTVQDLYTELDTQINNRFSEASIHPEFWWQLGKESSRQVYLTSATSNTVGHYDVTIYPQNNTSGPTLSIAPSLSTSSANSLRLNSASTIPQRPWHKFTNLALHQDQPDMLIPKLRHFIKEQLPDYMVPSTFVMLDAMPLSPAGKLDRHSLPEPKTCRPHLATPYIAPSTPTEKKLAEIWAETLGIEGIGIQDNFFELGGHSLLTIQLISRIAQVFTVDIPLSHLLQAPTISGLINEINPVQRSSTASSSTPQSALQSEEATTIDFDVETQLDQSIYPEQPFTELVTNPQYIFLTGASGFLGAFILDELLRSTEASIYCLVRANNLEEGRTKIQDTLTKFNLDKRELDNRIIPVLGDLAQPDLGLSPEQFSQLAHQLDTIYHCGACVNLVYPYAMLKQANVLGTQDILKLGCRGRTTPVHFISTIDVFQSPDFFNQAVIRENDVPSHGSQLGKGYPQSKWVGEYLVKEAQSRGLPVTIYRPGMLTGHSITGASQTNDLMCRIIKGIVQLQAAPRLSHHVNMIPIDYASRAIVYLSQQQQSLGNAFHIVNPTTIKWERLINQICSLGYPIKWLSHEQWQAQVHTANADNALQPMRSLFTQTANTGMTYLESFLLTAGSFDCQNTLRGLDGTGIECPTINPTIVEACITYFKEQNFIPKPTLSARLGQFIESDEQLNKPTLQRELFSGNITSPA
ncbi:MAG: amino acid adenylation domain-containing protein [Cyanobacteria bacterium P01_F01_bin.150]